MYWCLIVHGVTKGERWHLTWTCDFVFATKLPSVPRACSPGGAVTILRMFMRYIHTGQSCVRVTLCSAQQQRGRGSWHRLDPTTRPTTERPLPLVNDRHLEVVAELSSALPPASPARLRHGRQLRSISSQSTLITTRGTIGRGKG